MGPPPPYFLVLYIVRVGTSPEKDVNGLQRRRQKQTRFGKELVIIVVVIGIIGSYILCVLVRPREIILESSYVCFAPSPYVSYMHFVQNIRDHVFLFV